MKSPLPHTENGFLLSILDRWTVPHHGAKVVVLNLRLVCIDEVPPPFFARLALHLVLVDGGLGVEIGELLFEVFEDLVVHFGQTQF